MLEALSFDASYEQKSEIVYFPPFSAHIDFEFYENGEGKEFIRILHQKKAIPLGKKNIISLDEFKEQTKWLRLTNDEWTYRRTRVYPKEPLFNDEDLIEYLSNPRASLGL